MGKYVKWIEYKGIKILFNDYSGLNEEDYLDAMEETKQETINSNDKIIYTITVVSNTYATEKTKKKGSELERVGREKGIKSVAAIAGITGIKKVIALAIKRDLHFFNTVEEAKEWIVNQRE